MLLLFLVSASQAQEWDRRGWPCFSDPTGWRFGLVGTEIEVSRAVKLCEPCGRRMTYEELDGTLSMMQKLGIGRQQVFKTIYIDWRREQERIALARERMKERGLPCNEEEVEYRYIVCYLSLPPPSAGLMVSLTKDIEVTIRVAGAATGENLNRCEGISSRAVLATDSEREQNFCWDSRVNETIAADPKRLLSKKNSILLIAMFENGFGKIKDIEEVRLKGLQVVKHED